MLDLTPLDYDEFKIAYPYGAYHYQVDSWIKNNPGTSYVNPDICSVAYWSFTPQTICCSFCFRQLFFSDLKPRVESF